MKAWATVYGCENRGGRGLPTPEEGKEGDKRQEQRKSAKRDVRNTVVGYKLKGRKVMYAQSCLKYKGIEFDFRYPLCKVA